jgi:hypothetical protein
VAEAAAAKEEIESLLAIPSHFDPATDIQLTEWAKGEFDLERIVLDEEDVGGMRVGG